MRGAGAGAAKTVVIRFRHNEIFDRAPKTKVAKKDFDAGAGLVKVNVNGAAARNKKIGFVRSRFLEVLSPLQNDRLSRTPDTLKTKGLGLQEHLAAWK